MGWGAVKRSDDWRLYLTCFKLYEDDEVGDGGGHHAGQGAPGHLEQPVAGHGLQVVYLPEQQPRGLVVPRLGPVQILHRLPHVSPALVDVRHDEDGLLQQEEEEDCH